MIYGYDLDGVLLPDLNGLKGLKDSDIQPLLEMRRDYLEPIFIPEGSYYIITGRPYIDKDDTYKWSDKFLIRNPPLDIIININSTPNSSELDAAMFKTKMIYEKGIDIFIESNPIQAKHIQTLLLLHYDRNEESPRVIHFSDFLKIKIIEG